MTPFHAVRFYDSSDSIGRVVAAFVGACFTRGEPALVIATPKHRATIRAYLRGASFCLARLEQSRQLVVLDAAATLREIVVNGTPDPVRFVSVVGSLIDEIIETTHRQARVYDEMVDLLWKAHQHDAAVRVDTLWTWLLATRKCSLLCGHGPDVAGQTAQVLCAEHTHVLADNGVPHPFVGI